MDRITNALSSIPGYDGYRDKENRRETDRRVRDRISSRLGDLARTIEAVATELANRREIQAVGPVDSAAKAVRHLQDLVSTTSYGYGGLYSDRDVDAAALDQLNQFDGDLLTRVEALTPLVYTMQAAPTPADRDVALTAIRSALDTILSRFEERSFVVETGRPTSPSSTTSPLTVLEKEPTKRLMPAAFSLKKGDALSFDGANFIVDAAIDIEGQQPMKLFRIDVAPERWLLANARFAADLHPAEYTESGDAVVVDGQTLTQHGSGTAPSTVTGLGGSSGQQTVTYHVYGGTSEGGPLALTLQWPAATLRLVGHGISLDDIDVFGKPIAR
jgi:hypothetical protein